MRNTTLTLGFFFSVAMLGPALMTHPLFAQRGGGGCSRESGAMGTATTGGGIAAASRMGNESGFNAGANPQVFAMRMMQLQSQNQTLQQQMRSMQQQMLLMQQQNQQLMAQVQQLTHADPNQQFAGRDNQSKPGPAANSVKLTAARQNQKPNGHLARNGSKPPR